MEDLSGKQLGRYQVIAPLGEGGMAAVYKAYQPGMERYVALKILPQAYARDPEFTGRFEQEAKVIARLQHPHILPVHDYGEAESYTYIVMPLVETGTLADLLKKQPQLGLQRIRRIAIQVGDALDYAHSQGVIHRDVKPSNILIDKRGNCLLTDFGIAKMVEGTRHFTQTGGIVGTPHYMSPEQGSGGELTPASDIYALGVVIYEMATGRVPFDAETPMAVVIKHMHDPLPPPSSRNKDIGPALEGVILKAMAKDPQDRYATAAQLVEAIRNAIPERASATPSGQVTTVPAHELAEREAAARAGTGAPVGGEPPSAGNLVNAAEAQSAAGVSAAPAARRRSIAPWVAVGAVVLLGLCGLGAAGAYRLLAAGRDSSATESAGATAAAQASLQQTSEAANQGGTATALALAPTAMIGTTPSVATAVPVQPSGGLSSASVPSDLPAARWPVSMADAFDNNDNGWNPFQNFTDEFGSRSFTIQNGSYHWEITPDRDLSVHDNPNLAPFSDFYLAVDTRQLSGPNSTDYGVVFRRRSKDSFYNFKISEAGQFSFQMQLNGQWSTIVDWTESSAIQPGASNRITVVAVGTLFDFFINDQYVASATDDQLAEGVVGLEVDLFDPGQSAVWEFDNFELRQPWQISVAESFETSSNLWETGTNAARDLNETLSIAGGVYHWDFECKNQEFGCISSSYLLSQRNATDFELSVDARKLDGPVDAEYGVRFRYDGDNYLEFLITDSGTFSALLWYQDNLDYYYFDVPAPSIVPGGINRLTISAQGSSFALYINGVKAGEVDEQQVLAGGFGLTASVSGPEQAVFEFDNFTLRQP